MKLVNTIPVAPVGEDEALLPRKASPWRGPVARAAAVSLALGLVASAATGGVSTTSLSSKKHAGRFETPKGGKVRQHQGEGRRYLLGLAEVRRVLDAD